MTQKKNNSAPPNNNQKLWQPSEELYLLRMKADPGTWNVSPEKRTANFQAWRAANGLPHERSWDSISQHLTRKMKMDGTTIESLEKRLGLRPGQAIPKTKIIVSLFPPSPAKKRKRGDGDEAYGSEESEESLKKVYQYKHRSLKSEMGLIKLGLNSLRSTLLQRPYRVTNYTLESVVDVVQPIGNDGQALLAAGESKKTIAEYEKACEGFDIDKYDREEAGQYLARIVESWLAKPENGTFLRMMAAALRQADKGLELMREWKEVNDAENEDRWTHILSGGQGPDCAGAIDQDEDLGLGDGANQERTGGADEASDGESELSEHDDEEFE